MNNNKQSKLEFLQSAWAKLSNDLLGEIMSGLSLLSDHVRFRAVCKNWLQMVDEYSNNIFLLPWSFHIKFPRHYNRAECHLSELLPSNIMKPTLVYKINLPRSELDVGCDVPITHKYGWIFAFIIDCHLTSFLLFSPFTKKEIILPRLNFSATKYNFVTQTFTTKPDSQDCVLIVLHSSAYKDRIIINIFRHGYKERKSQEFDYSLCSWFGNMPVCIDGNFYFVFRNGQLASYNLDYGERKVESELNDNSFHGHKYSKQALFELNGELMLISIWQDTGCITMFDRSRKTWFPLKSLGDQSLFFSYNSIFLRTIKKEGKSNHGLLPDKVYYREYADQIVYSLESGKLTKYSDESEITKRAKADDLRGYWFEPPDDLVKKKDPWKLLKLSQELRKPGVVVELVNSKLGKRKWWTEDDELDNLMDQTRK